MSGEMFRSRCFRSTLLVPMFVIITAKLIRLTAIIMKLLVATNNGSSIVPLNSLGGSTLQLGTRRGFLCLASRVVVLVFICALIHKPADIVTRDAADFVG